MKYNFCSILFYASIFSTEDWKLGEEGREGVAHGRHLGLAVECGPTFLLTHKVYVFVSCLALVDLLLFSDSHS